MKKIEKKYFLVKSLNINNVNAPHKIVNKFKTIRAAAKYVKEENYKNHISNSCEHLYY